MVWHVTCSKQKSNYKIKVINLVVDFSDKSILIYSLFKLGD